jgi:acyl-CoA reductase-like NAD-dependent aldehyde dehydrogenase
LGARLAKVKARPWDDHNAEISAFANPDVADRISGMIDNLLQTPGAEDVCVRLRGTPRVYKEGRCAWLLPSVVLCDSAQHPLANKEFLFPYVTVIECPQDEMLATIGPSLVVSAITGDPEFTQQLLDCNLVERLNIGAISTVRLSWDQPHEGNLFTHLYRQRAFAEAPV